MHYIHASLQYCLSCEPYYGNMLTNKKRLKAPALVLSLKRNMFPLRQHGVQV